jgi:hypothetical protein
MVALVITASAGVADAASSRTRSHDSHMHRMTAYRSVAQHTAAMAPARRVDHPFLVPDPVAYARAKRLADARAAAALGRQSPPVIATSPPAPVLSTNWQGLKDGTTTPSDSTGAIGTSRYIELVNSQAAIYTRSGVRVGAQMTLQELTGSGATDAVFDPQIIWDGQQNRFFYAADQVVSPTDNRIAFGWSKTATPSSALDFCKYYSAFGSEFPDYPKLGDTRDFLLVGVNEYNGTTYDHSNVFAAPKPPAGPTCPTSFSTWVSDGLTDDTSLVNTFTPVPAQQTDTSATGWVVTRVADVLGATSLYLYSVTTSAGAPAIDIVGAPVTVPAYDYPSSALQPGVTPTIDTSDTRLTQAVSAIDPRFGRVAVWTQHTVASGVFSGVRWYEIDPTNGLLFQTGLVRATNTWVFNGALAPDRQVRGSQKHFGSNMVLTYSSSSSSTFSTIWVRSKRGAAAISAARLVKASTAADIDFACNSAALVCRWGDYSAATPDPVLSPANAVRGHVWITNQFNANPVDPVNNAYWRTWNAAVNP